jgi:hypothetical protein
MRTFSEHILAGRPGIIRLWNALRLLEKEGREPTALRDQIKKALAERDRRSLINSELTLKTGAATSIGNGGRFGICQTAGMAAGGTGLCDPSVA